MYEYTAKVLKVVDGDTVHLEVDLGFDVRRRDTFRLAGIDAPEMSTAAGQTAREWLADEIPVGVLVRITTIKDRREKYGRYLAVIWNGDENLNQRMVDEGYAVPYDGGRR